MARRSWHPEREVASPVVSPVREEIDECWAQLPCSVWDPSARHGDSHIHSGSSFIKISQTCPEMCLLSDSKSSPADEKDEPLNHRRD